MPGSTRPGARYEEQRITLGLPDTDVPSGRTLFLGEQLRVRLGDKDVFAGQGIDLTIRARSASR